MTNSWQDIFVLVIMGLVFLFGAPITQLFKNLLSKLFKTTVEEKWALLLSGVVAVGIALLEMWLNGLLDHLVITRASLPDFIAYVWGFAQVYYNLFSKASNALGTKALLKPPSA